MAVSEVRFRAMASGVHVIFVGATPTAAAHVQWRLHDLENRWSRFVPDSEIHRLNHAHGSWTAVSDETLVLLSAMAEGWRLSGCRYDPALLSPLLAAGYVRSHDGSGRECMPPTMELSAPMSADDILVDAESSSVRLPLGLALDPGGIGKGLAADLLVGELLAQGCHGVLVSIGGDLAAGGMPPSSEGWHVAIADPFCPDSRAMTLAFDGGGVATSSTLSRSWTHRGRRRHHIIDPQTRASAGVDLVAATVVAQTGWQAEAHATGALLSSSEGFLDYLQDRGLSGVAVARSGEMLATCDLVPQLGERSVS